MELVLKALIAGLALATAKCFMSNPQSGCFVDPGVWFNGYITDSEKKVELGVPAECNTGRLTWSYPHGHLLLYFPNPQGANETVCLHDWFVGITYNVTDVTDGRENRLSNITGDSWRCTDPSTSKKLVLKFDAPNMMYSSTGFLYKVYRH